MTDYLLAVKKMWLLLAAMIVCLPAVAEEAPKIFGAWQLYCENGQCRIRQGLANPERPGIVYGSEVQYMRGKEGAYLTLSFPLGIYLPPGIGLKVGDLTRDAPMTVCLPIGCQAIIEIDDELASGLQSAKDYQVRFYTTKGSPNEVTYSLTGFVQAHRELAGMR